MQNLGVSIIEELGRGTSGIVYKVINKEGKFFVVKIVDFGKLSQKKQTRCMKEVEILKRLTHPHIIRYEKSAIVEGVLYLMTEFAAGGDLQKKIDRQKASRKLFEEGQVWIWTYEIALALRYLHKHKVLHRDVKCMNIFLDKDNRIKIGDFGLAKILKNNKEISSNTVGTPLYLAPEQIRHLPYGLKVDIWGLGCVVYKLCSLDPPFSGDSLLALGQNIVHKSYKPLPTKFTPKLVTFISQLLDKNPKTRLSSSEVFDLIPIFTKKFYKAPLKIEKKAETAEEKIEETPSQVVFPRFSYQALDKSSQGPLKRLIVNEQRPISQGMKRIFASSSDAVRLSTAYVRQRFMKDNKPKTTISDLARIV